MKWGGTGFNCHRRWLTAVCQYNNDLWLATDQVSFSSQEHEPRSVLKGGFPWQKVWHRSDKLFLKRRVVLLGQRHEGKKKQNEMEIKAQPSVERKMGGGGGVRQRERRGMWHKMLNARHKKDMHESDQRSRCSGKWKRRKREFSRIPISIWCARHGMGGVSKNKSTNNA